MDLKEIQNLIKFVSNSGVAEVKLETGDIKIHNYLFLVIVCYTPISNK